MTYGDPKRGWNPWVLDQEQSLPFYRRAVECGINFFDTANTYSTGASEEVLGVAMREFARREEVVIATKVGSSMSSVPAGPMYPNGAGLSRKHILAAIDASLRRLKMDYVDLYQIHRPDRNTPIEETMEAMNDVVRAGKARYIGASNFYAWQFVKAQYLADLHRWTRFVSMQSQYNLLYRGEENEMYPCCIEEGVGILAWSPLARGFLAGNRHRTGGGETARAQLDPTAMQMFYR
jgi:aryl-alcohol dehydrogenase (NADP+)